MRPQACLPIFISLALIATFPAQAQHGAGQPNTAARANPQTVPVQSDRIQVQDRDMDQERDRDRDRDRERIYGYDLMTDAEREAYRERLRSFEREREAFRLEHRRAMQDRARARGVPPPKDDDET